jgi:hypothetical protein
VDTIRKDLDDVEDSGASGHTSAELRNRWTGSSFLLTTKMNAWPSSHETAIPEADPLSGNPCAIGVPHLQTMILGPAMPFNNLFGS